VVWIVSSSPTHSTGLQRALKTFLFFDAVRVHRLVERGGQSVCIRAHRLIDSKVLLLMFAGEV